MTGIDYILEGLEAELALERELGVRSIEIDRELLAVPTRPQRQVSSTPPPSLPSPSPSPPSSPSAPALTSSLSLAFLHHRPLSAAGVEMMAKIISALKLPEGATAVVVAPPRPKAKVYVVLGGLALKTWFPGLVGAPGAWLTGASGEAIYVTYSPEYILRFKTVTPAVKKIKLEMWQGIKSALKKI